MLSLKAYLPFEENQTKTLNYYVTLPPPVHSRSNTAAKQQTATGYPISQLNFVTEVTELMQTLVVYSWYLWAS